MMKRTGLALAAGLLAVSAMAANVSSGLKPGAQLPAFDVVDVSGPSKGKQLCYRCQFGGSPVLAAFIKGNPADAAALVGSINAAYEANKGKKLKSFIVFTGGPELKNAIEKLAAEKKTSVPLTLLPQGTTASDYAKYEINPAAGNTVLLWNKGTVEANFVNVKAAEFAPVDKAIGAMLQ